MFKSNSKKGSDTSDSSIMDFRFRPFSRGWKPRFDIDFDDFFGRPTIRDTGKGSAKRHTRDFTPKGYTRPEPKSYDEIKAECLDSGELWEDPDFPACDESLYYKDPPTGWPDIEWLRPKEICERIGFDGDPELFVEGASRLDVNQGVLGDCWLLAAVSCLATNGRLLHRIIPDGQSFTEDYAGVFRFMFWQYGRWVEVVIDDRLPCCNDKLIYMHSDDRNEFWSAMLEKAYAKLHGCYENLSGGLTSEALTDFTGGISERYELRDKAPEDLFKTMLKAHKTGAMMGCSIDAAPEEMEARQDNGLIIGHAYSITDVRYIEVETPRYSGQVPMVRVRNPWGDSHEWQGAWSDQSEEWSVVPDDEKESLGLTYDHDGEFWMSFRDFADEYQRLEICYLGPDTPIDEDMGDVAEEINKWEGSLMEGSWRRRVNAGGCRNFPTFWCNPQYRITVVDPDEDDEDGNGVVVVGLMQKERRKLRSEGKDNLTVGFAIYALDDPDCGTLDNDFFQNNRMSARSPNFINMREVSDHYSLPPGTYVVVPSTFEPEQEGDFIIRVFSLRPTDTVEEIDVRTENRTIRDGDEGSGYGMTNEDLAEQDDDDVARMENGYEAFRGRAGEDGEVDAYELREMLNEIFQQEFEFDGFSIDMCRSMVSMTDADLSGKLNYRDYKALWSELNLCVKAFKKMDADGSGFFSSYEFRPALNSLGLQTSNSTFNAIVNRYSDQEGHVRFDDFVACVMKLRTMFGIFRGKSSEGEEATFETDEFIQMTMYS